MSNLPNKFLKNNSLNLTHLLIGNDVVNISLARCLNKHLDLRFIRKILHPNEQINLNLSNNKTVNLWMMWSGKEAAFKACQKSKIDLIFSPSKFEVAFNFKELDKQLNSLKHISDDIYINGIIKFKDELLQARWNLNSTLVHCICLKIINNSTNSFPNLSCKNYWEKINYKIFNIDSSTYSIESADTKLKATQYLMKYGLTGNIEIKRPMIFLNGLQRLTPPQLFINNQHHNYQISLSHDHGFGAIAFLDLNSG